MATAKQTVKRLPAKKPASPPSKTVAKKATAPAPSSNAAEREIRVRMYDVGFGDAFLVTIPTAAGERRILFDCGSVEASKVGGPMSGIVDRIIADAGGQPGTEANIDLVVATHRHKDHVSGFANARWNTVRVKEVWMPWTEHPTDPEARRIRDLQTKMAVGLSASLAKPARGLAPAQLAERDISLGVVENALTLANDAAMKTLHSGFQGSPKRRFLPTPPTEKSDGRQVETDALPGVRVHVLGPSRDPDVIRDMEPGKGESYLRLNAARQSGSAGSRAPFAAEFVHTRSPQKGSLTASDKGEIDAAGDMSDLSVAAALDKAVNGTSLMLLLEVEGTFLLFPGDAQWGTWMAVLADPEWRDLLQRVSFYKIGHHASHNATPPGFVEELLPLGCCAMASTLKRKIWPSIPRIPIFTALLKKKASLARSDTPPPSGKVFKVAPGVVEARVPF